MHPVFVYRCKCGGGCAATVAYGYGEASLMQKRYAQKPKNPV